MHWFRITAHIAANALGLWLADKYVQGFGLSTTLWQLVFIALILTALNFILKPVLTLIMGPIIVVTLGLGVIIVNAVILKLLALIADHLDLLHGSITIQSIPALIFATLIVSAVNFIIHIAF